jgi:coproporphyrinogen III oxidase
MNDLESIQAYFEALQQKICLELEAEDGRGKFRSDLWNREEGGGGDSRIMEQGAVFEKGGVNFSHVHGTLPEFLRSETNQAAHFDATGVSIVIHPANPFVPIIHMNVRYFQMSDKPDGAITDRWFGGGIDLTPAYVFDEDAVLFHQALKSACDPHDALYYPRFKKWCDEYFYIVHRQEMRGVGGIFFDHLRPGSDAECSALFSFARSVGDLFAPTYRRIVERRKSLAYDASNRQWQYIRRGRYAEFNLVYDRGTAFGLKTNGRIESILMSMPPVAHWVYDHHPRPGSVEERSLSRFQPRDWL